MKSAVSGLLRIVLMAVAALELSMAPLQADAAPATHRKSASALALRADHPVSDQSGLAPAIALSYRAERLKAAFRSGDLAARQAAVQDVESLRRTYSTMDVLPLVEAMAVFARQLGDEHRPELGLEVVETVDRWAPGYPTLLGTRVVLLRQQGFVGSLVAMADVMELTRMRLGHPVHRWLWLVQHIAWLRLLATLLLWGWAATMALRYRRVFRNLWEDPMARRGLNNHTAAILGAVLVTLPVLLGLDPSLVAMVWLILLAPFMLPTEISCTFLVLALQLVHPGLALLEPMAARQPEPSLVTLQIRPQAVVEDAKILGHLPAGDRTFLEGWRRLQFQDWARAEKDFSSLLRTHPDQVEVLNDLGVAQFQVGDLAGAQASFDAAFKLNPRRVEVLLNQSVVAYKQLDSTVGAAKQEDARDLAPEDFTRILAISQTGNDQRAIPLPLPDSPERIQAVRLATGAAQRPEGGGAKGYAFLFNLIAPLLALGCFWLRLHGSVSGNHPTQCSRCGEPFHTTDSTDAFVCSKCHHLFVLKDGLHSESRKKKVDGVAGFQESQRWIHRTLMVILPGADRCFLGDTRSGFVEFAFLCFALGIVLATAHSVRYPGEILADPASVWLPLGLLLLAVLFIRSWLKLLPRLF